MNKKAIDTIVVVGTQRSGTTWLMQVLNQVDNFRVYGEVFREITSDEFYGDPALKPKLFYKEYKPSGITDNPCYEYVSEVLKEGEKITVFKIMYDQIRRNLSLVKLMRQDSVLVVNVERRDIFEIALSKILARRSGVYHSESELDYEPFHLRYKHIYIMMAKEKIKQIMCPPLINIFSKNYSYHVYEELVADLVPLDSLLMQSCELQSVKLKGKETKWKKVDKSKKYSAIKNFEELKTRIKRSFFKGDIK